MTTIKSGASVFLVDDIIASANYYRDKLGFRYDQFWGEPPDFCMAWRDEQCIMLSKVKDISLIRPVSSVRDVIWDAYFWIDDCDAMYEELNERGAQFHYEPTLKPYGVKEFAVTDLDNYRIAFGEEM